MSHECPECGNNVSVDEDGYAECYGVPGHFHQKRELVRPCGMCEKPIRTAEICEECAEKHEGTAFTTNWGSNGVDL